jgi:hypothetical protein
MTSVYEGSMRCQQNWRECVRQPMVMSAMGMSRCTSSK